MNTQHLFDIEYTKELAERIKSVDLDDTTLRDYYDELMNTLTRGFGFTLVMCPECNTIDARKNNDEIPCKNGRCGLIYRASDAPDLFS